LPSKHVLIFSERPPPAPEAPATGLSVRHALMAEALSAAGFDVTYAWPGGGDPGRVLFDQPVQFGTLDVGAHGELAHWIDRYAPHSVILGYWKLADWIPTRLERPLVLDHVAPRLLERQFENRDELAADAAGLIEVLARCDEVWVGNAPQRDLMLPLVLLAGHDCRYEIPVRVVPIAGRTAGRTAGRIEVGAAERTAGDRNDSLRLFHGGRDWPWRNSKAWLAALRDHDGPWRLTDAGEQAGLTGRAQYLELLGASDLALELGDDNTERRYSQSFRMTDALCAGVPVICNDFLPLAELVERHECGWTVGGPEELPALLETIAADRAELARRGENASRLARAQFDADDVYGRLAGPLAALAERGRTDRSRPLIGSRAPGSSGTGPGMASAFGQYLSKWADRRLRKPWQNRLSRKMAGRPMPGAGGACWVVLGRSDVFPTNHGAAVKIERTAWGLSFHVDEVILLTDRRDGYWLYRGGEREFRRFPAWPRLAGWPAAVNRIRVMARGVPYSEALLYLPWVDRGMQFRLLWLIKRHPVEVVQGEYPAYARPAVWAARLFGSRSLMVEHNVEFKRLAEQASELGDATRRRLKRLEVNLANACDKVVTVSDHDRDELVSAGVREALVHTIPHGVDLQRYAGARPVDLRTRYDIPAEHAVLVYHGAYSYPPNLDAVDELAGVLLPRLRAAGCPARVVAFGPQPPERKLPGIVFAGPVDDLAGHLKGGDIAVIPLRQGGGTRMKILDDFAARVPVVTTSKGMEGMAVEHGKHLLVVDDPDEMAAAVIDLLGDEQARHHLAEGAAHWVARFDWREIARAYVELMRRVK